MRYHYTVILFHLRSSKSDSALRAFSSPRGYEKTRGNSGPPIAHRPDDNLVNEQVLAEVNI